jgi:hypothetical protein
MPWGKLDDSLYDHPKLNKLGRNRLAGVGLWSVAISWCNRRLTDGHVPLEQIKRLGGTVRLADALVVAGLLERTPDGYLVHDFLHFNESKATVLARRAAEAERQRKRREAEALSRAESGRDNGRTPTVSTSTPSSPVPSSPNPRSTPTPSTEASPELRYQRDVRAAFLSEADEERLKVKNEKEAKERIAAHLRRVELRGETA